MVKNGDAVEVKTVELMHLAWKIKFLWGNLVGLKA